MHVDGTPSTKKERSVVIACDAPLSENDRPPYVMLLNPDTILREGAVQKLAELMDAHATVGIAGSRLEDPDGTPQVSAFRFHSIAGEFERSVRLGLVTRMLAR